MTYCVGILVKEGLTMIADTRTNAGLDNVSQYKKLHIFEKPGDRMIAVATAGNLAITQAVLSFLNEGIENKETGQTETIWTTPSMFKTAQLVGRAVREVYRIDGEALEQSNAGFEVTLLVGGQVAKGRLRLFMVYRQGNFIEATEDTPFLQIGEHKYGKPILDRVVKPNTSLADAEKAVLLSMDSTLRSNLSVGMPLDLCIIEKDACRVSRTRRIEPGDAAFRAMSEGWSKALRDGFLQITL